MEGDANVDSSATVDGSFNFDSDTWPSIMTAWSAELTNSAIYSISYADTPPDGVFVRGVSYAANITDTCSTFEREDRLQRSSTLDAWFMLIQVSQNKVGTYTVSPRDQVGSELTAQIIIKHAVNGVEVERHTALSGSVTVTKVPVDEQEQVNGASFSLGGTVEFSKREALSNGCSVSGTVTGDASTVESTCYCEYSDGGMFSCDYSLEQPNCCIDVDADRETFDILVRAVPCASVCAAPITLLTYCNGVKS